MAKAFKDELRRWRLEHGFETMAAACRAEGIPYRTWQDWELGNRTPKGFALSQWKKRFAVGKSKTKEQKNEKMEKDSVPA